MSRLPDDEIQRRLDEALERVRMTPEEALERWPELDQSARDVKQAQSEMARAKHAVVVDDETGQRLLGGPQPNSGPRDRRSLLEQVAHLANDERQQEVVDALFAPLSDKEAAAVRGKGAERISRMVVAHEDEQRKNRDELRKLSKDELVSELVKQLLNSGLGGSIGEALARQLPDKSFDAHGTAEAA